MKKIRLIIPIEGRINTENASEFEKMLMEKCNEISSDERVLLDAEKLAYISSAGLRVILKLKKKINDLTVINVTQEIFDIFEVTGITRIMNIVRIPRNISIEGLEKIGQGGTSDVYRLDNETIIKLFIIGYPLGRILRERELAQKAFIAGVPTVISYDIVKAGDRLGVIYELLNCKSLKELLIQQPENDAENVTKLIKLLISNAEIDTTGLDVLPYVNHLKMLLDEMTCKTFTIEEANIILSIICQIPQGNGFIHGDLHPGNVFIQNDELFMIDMVDMASGNPLFDLAGMCLWFKVIPTYHTAKGCIEFTGIKPERALRLWDIILDAYVDGVKADDKDLISKYVLSVACVLFVAGSYFGDFFPREITMRMKKEVVDLIKNMT